MNDAPANAPNTSPGPINWQTALFVVLSPIAAAALVWHYAANHGIGWFEIGHFVVMCYVTGLGITDQPKLDMGGYSRRSVRVSLPVVELRPLIEMLADIENSTYPVAIERIQMTGGRMRTGYTVKLAVNAYDREGASPTEQE